MITFCELLPNIKIKLQLENEQEILRKIKKPCPRSMQSHSSGEKRIDIIGTKIDTDGSVKMYVDDLEYPISGYPDAETLYLTTLYKRFLPLMADSLLNQGWIGRIITLLALSFNWKIAPKWFEYVFSLRPALLNDENYCKPVKELRRVLKGKIDEHILDAISLVIEYDGAYRYRMQDILAEKEKNPVKLIDIMISRDKLLTQVPKYRAIQKLVKLAMFIPKIRKTITSILNDIDRNEIKLSKADRYWLERYNNAYNYGQE